MVKMLYSPLGFEVWNLQPSGVDALPTEMRILTACVPRSNSVIIPRLKQPTS